MTALTTPVSGFTHSEKIVGKSSKLVLWVTIAFDFSVPSLKQATTCSKSSLDKCCQGGRYFGRVCKFKGVVKVKCRQIDVISNDIKRIRNDLGEYRFV